MNLSVSEIEIIVREVLSRLTAQDPIDDPVDGGESSLTLDENVITTQLLKNRLRGVKTVKVRSSAVITPAAKDLCRDAHATILRSTMVAATRGETGLATQHAAVAPSTTRTTTTPTTTAPNSREQLLMVSGSDKWMTGIQKQLCPKLAFVNPPARDDASALREIANGVRNGHRAGVLIVEAPHATCWQAARDEKLRPAVLGNWSDLNNILRELPVNTLILSSKTWNIPGVCNVARYFIEHLNRKS